MKRTLERITPGDLIQALVNAGASFRQTEGGSWLLDVESSLPGWLLDEFLASDERKLGEHLRQQKQQQKEGEAQ